MKSINLNDKDLKELYYKPDYGLISQSKFIKKLKADGKYATPSSINKLFENQEVNQRLKQVKKQKDFNTITANYPGDSYQIDICNYSRYTYRKYKYILVVIDVYSRYVDARPMTSRENPVIMKHIESIFDNLGYPYRIQCDNEFDTIAFEIFCKRYDIKTHFSEPNEMNKNSIVERFNRTMIGQLQKYRLTHLEYDWYKYLHDIIKNYNGTYHDTIENIPAKVWNHEEYNEQIITRIIPTYNVGDKVRVLLHKKIFDKSDKLIHSKEIYIITEVLPHTYKLNNDKFYKQYELVKTSDNVSFHKEELRDKDLKEPRKKIEQPIYTGITTRANAKTLRSNKNY